MAFLAPTLALMAALQATSTDAPAAPQCLSISDAIETSLEYDPRVEASAADQLAARANVMAAYSRNLPQVSAFGQSGFGDTPPLDRRSDEQAGLQLQQELYSFGSRRYAIEAAKAQHEAARHGVNEAQVSVAQGIAQAYLEHARSLELAALAGEQEAAFGEEAATAESRLSRQVITLTDASQITARFARARSDALAAGVEVEASLARLEVLLGHQVKCLDEDASHDTLTRNAPAVLGMAPVVAVDEALIRSARIARVQAQLKAARATAEEAERAGLPTIALNGFVLWERGNFPDETGLTFEERIERESRIGVSLSQELFTGGRNRARALEGNSRVRGARAEARFQELAVEDAVRRALARAKAQRDAAAALTDARNAASVQKDGTQREYDVGTKTLTDLVLATESFFIAATQETNARYDYYLSLVQLYAAMNMLNELDVPMAQGAPTVPVQDG